MRQDLIDKGYIPLDKSWMIRMGVLDLVSGRQERIAGFLIQHYDELNADLRSLYTAVTQWNERRTIDVGESATLYRFLRFASWKLRQEKDFVLQGTLTTRKHCEDAAIVDWPLERLLTLDNRTSQWASAAVLMGNTERIPNPPFKLQVTYDAVEHWNAAKREGKSWEPRFDETIWAQASAYLQWLKEGKMVFVPEQAEDYCFARAFGLITAQEGEAKWPSLRNHESDRIAEMEEMLLAGNALEDAPREIMSKDHRAVQAVTMLRRSTKNVSHPACVNKSWPQFWRFLQDSPKLL
jgi:Holliday junction resolvase-like predicted endonuclease